MNALGVVLVLSLLGAGGVDTATPLACPTSPQWAAVIEAHLSHYPGMEVVDLYKLLHQGALGSEHAVPNADAARAWMDDELDTMGNGPTESVVDTIAPGGTHVRVHLRPFMERGGDSHALVAAFIETAEGDSGSEEALLCAVDTSLRMARDGALPWSETELTRYVEAWRDQGYPAVHHSETFAATYRPAYRVVAGSLLAEVLETLR